MRRVLRAFPRAPGARGERSLASPKAQPAQVPELAGPLLRTPSPAASAGAPGATSARQRHRSVRTGGAFVHAGRLEEQLRGQQKRSVGEDVQGG